MENPKNRILRKSKKSVNSFVTYSSVTYMDCTNYNPFLISVLVGGVTDVTDKTRLGNTIGNAINPMISGFSVILLPMLPIKQLKTII